MWSFTNRPKKFSSSFVWCVNVRHVRPNAYVVLWISRNENQTPIQHQSKWSKINDSNHDFTVVVEEPRCVFHFDGFIRLVYSYFVKWNGMVTCVSTFVQKLQLQQKLVLIFTSYEKINEGKKVPAINRNQKASARESRCPTDINLMRTSLIVCLPVIKAIKPMCRCRLRHRHCWGFADRFVFVVIVTICIK